MCKVCIASTVYIIDSFSHIYLQLLFNFYMSLKTVLDEAHAATHTLTQNDTAANSQATKDDIIHLMHIFKEPMAQRHWSYLHE